MMNCWQSEPEARPSFNNLTQQLKHMEDQHKVRLNSKLLKKECFKFCLLRTIVEFRVHQNRWIQVQTTHMYRVGLKLKKNIHEYQQESVG